MKKTFSLAILFVFSIFIFSNSFTSIPKASASYTYTTHSIGSFYAGQDIEAIDVDSDGDIDIIGGAYAAGGGIYWYENNGSGSFTKHDIHTSSSYDYMFIDAGDIDGDGDIDAVVSERDGYVYLYTNNGSESFARSTVASSLYDPRKIQMGDVEGDGDIDVLVPNGEYTSTWVGNIKWYENDGSETFYSNNLDTDQKDAYAAALGDLDGDSDNDIIGVGNTWGNTAKYISNGALSPTFTETYVDSGAKDVQILDMDGDSDLDFATVSYYNLTWYENDGSASFTEHTINTELNNGSSLYVDDIDGDSDYDMLVAAAYGGVSWWENDGSFGYTRHDVVGNISNSTSFGELADLDGDSDLEIICFSASSTLSWFELVPDSTPPTASFSPADDAVDVATDANLVMTFDENVDVESGNIVIYNAADDSAFATIPVGDAQVTGTGTTTITINPTSDLAEETSYYVQIDATAFDDAASNSYAGISDTTTWSFTTADETAPTASFSPADDATDGSTESLIITFSENVDVESGNIVIYNAADDSTFATIPVGDAQVTGTGTTTITITPTTALTGGASYYVKIDATAFDDASSNSYAGISNATTWNFTTANTGSSSYSVPNITSKSPSNGETGVDTDTELNLSFSKDVYLRYGDIRILDNSTEEIVETIPATSDLISGHGTKSISIDPSVSLSEGTEYSVEIDTSVFMDSRNNKFGGIYNGAWVFTTGSGDDADNTTITDTDNETADSEDSTEDAGGPSNGNTSFPDVSADHESSPSIEYLHEMGVINGYPDEEFKPENKMNRAEFIKVIVELTGITPSEKYYYDCFPDVTDQWFAPYVCYAESEEWIQGYDDGYFYPAKEISKAAMLKVLFKSKNIDLDTIEDPSNDSGFSDVPNDSWYFVFAMKAKELGLIDEDEFNAGYLLNRAEVCDLIFKLLNLL